LVSWDSEAQPFSIGVEIVDETDIRRAVWNERGKPAATVSSVGLRCGIGGICLDRRLSIVAVGHRHSERGRSEEGGESEDAHET
jgi:hypothetical protein